MPRWQLRLTGLCALAVSTALLSTSTASADEPAPTPSYSYLGGVATHLANPGSAPPGANDPTCRPTAQRPEPVVLLHGLSNQTITWNTMAPVLRAHGYCVFSTDYGVGQLGSLGAVSPIDVSAAQIAAFIDQVLATTGAEKVDVIGHSMGGAVPFYYLNYLGGIPKVDDYIAMAAPLDGTTLSGLQTMFAAILDHTPDLEALLSTQCGPCQLTPGSPYLRVLNPDPAIAPDIDFTTIVTRYDEVATPYSTGMLAGPNVRNIVVQDLCATDFTEHYQLTSDPVAIHAVLDTLDPGTAQTGTCEVVLPVIGPVGR